jgi:hypothetical protein
MAIMTGVQSPQVLGASTEKQAELSRQSMEESTDNDINALNGDTDTGTSAGTTDGGADTGVVGQKNEIDVIR